MKCGSKQDIPTTKVQRWWGQGDDFVDLFKFWTSIWCFWVGKLLFLLSGTVYCLVSQKRSLSLWCIRHIFEQTQLALATIRSTFYPAFWCWATLSPTKRFVCRGNTKKTWLPLSERIFSTWYHAGLSKGNCLDNPETMSFNMGWMFLVMFRTGHIAMEISGLPQAIWWVIVPW